MAIELEKLLNDVKSGRLKVDERLMRRIKKLEADKKHQELVDAIKSIKIEVPAPKIPEIIVPEVIVPEVQLPDIKVNVPKIDPPEVTIPEIKLPEINVKVPDVIVPEIKIPEIKVPKIDPVVVPAPKVTVKQESVKFPKTAKEAIPVRLVHDGKFYRGGGGTTGGVANIHTFATADNSSKPALVSSEGHVQTNIKAQDSASIDAFGRWRTSGVGNRLDVEFNYDLQEELVDAVTNGNGSATHVANTRGVTLATGGTGTDDNSALYTYDVPYTPGNSQLIEATGVLDLAGIGGGVAQIFLRSSVSGSPVEEVYNQTAWTENTVSDIDWTFSQIFMMDLQSLKVGRIRFYLNRGGNAVKVHEILNDNKINTGYWQLANQPVYWKIYNDATYTYMEIGYGDDDNAIGFRYRIAKNASATMSAICGTVKSEGGDSLFNISGYPRSIDLNVTPKTVSTSPVVLLSIRPKATFNSIVNKSLSIAKSFFLQTDNPIKIMLIHNATLTGASWVNVDANESAIEYDKSASSYTGGHILFSDYISASKNTTTSAKGLLGKTPLWYRRNSDTGILTLVAVRSSGTDASVLAGLNWEEIR